jgi:antirestriction protein ArdC
VLGVPACARGGLARLSLSNQLLVALARPDATFVAGFKAWLDLGYCVRKGEKAIRIIAPDAGQERDRAAGQETGETITPCKGVSIVDAQQVEPLPDAAAAAQPASHRAIRTPT